MLVTLVSPKSTLNRPLLTARLTAFVGAVQPRVEPSFIQ
jgi:hypothetical protein